ncbi:hypothetical protein [Paramaledivibacter caminithermalis]|uniref:Thioredoxin n=1 Tax=Paramaledivibacter caminithermalis (strain DSM 15212 / CIP 107654 / DViRD3) TaxID=1121301 RepID=A0A1M6LX61_PARC5|nr:hypothetical protein [Paramaledivibacter caminithermalis]SHJ75778.1 hypothetical protein SAMN02745912_00958 [Paramaledivibacter caminithermalis DSM 15212]
MSKKKFGILILVILAVVGVILAKELFAKSNIESTNEGSFSIEQEYEKIKKINKPSIIIFTYEGDCCESTKKFFDNYNSMANKLISKYKDSFESLYINTGILSKDDQEILMKIANENSVKKLPTIVIRNYEGKVIKVIEGPFIEKEVKDIMDGLVK